MLYFYGKGIVLIISGGVYVLSSLYKENKTQDKFIDEDEEDFKEKLNDIDISKANRLISIVKKEMKEKPFISSLSFEERKYIDNYCKLLLEGDEKGIIKGFSEERIINCCEIIKYCNCLE
jgi:hypothetical protein